MVTFRLEKVYALLTLILALLLAVACKKQKASEPTASFAHPKHSKVYKYNEVIPLTARIRDEDGIILIESYILSPTKSKINIENINQDVAIGQKLKDVYGSILINESSGAGNYQWVIEASNKFKTERFTQNFTVGNIVQPDPKELNIAIVESYNTATTNDSTQIALYSENGTKKATYMIEARAEDIVAHKNNLYYYEGFQGAFVANGFSGRNNTKILTSVLNKGNPWLFKGENAILNINSTVNQLNIYNSAATNDVNINNNFNRSESLYQLDGLIFSCELNPTGSGYKIVTYNKETGGVISSLNIPYKALGFFSFGKNTEIYFLTQHPNNSSRTAVWFFNYQANSVSQINSITNLPSIRNALYGQNPLEVYKAGKNGVWIITDQGVYEFDAGRTVVQKTINSSVNWNSLWRTEFSESYKSILFVEDYARVYNIKKDTESARIQFPTTIGVKRATFVEN